MSNNDALAQARALVDALLEAAQKGTITGRQLPVQVQAIADTLAQVNADVPEPQQTAPELPADFETLMREQAEFMSVAIHDLRLPLTSLRGYADMLNMPAMGELTDMQRQFVQTILTNTRRMESLLMDVSDINKLRASLLRPNLKMDMYKNIGARVEKAMLPTAQETNRVLTFDYPQGLPLLNTDGDLLARALGKLVENALRYTHDGGHVTVSAHGENNMLHIHIHDDGIGMTPEELTQLGTPYFRSEDEYVRNYKGSGLGIPIAYGIIHMLGGSVHVESQHGQGTSFTISLTGVS
jgi:signal transduction histidine kinase